MKPPVITAIAIVASVTALAAESDSRFGAHPANAPAPPAAAIYLAESPLPKGWPAPGPFNQAVRKNYPASRVAITQHTGPNRGFWRLFQHIQQRGIPMTAPVAMNLDANQPAGLNIQSMAFLYQSPEIGTLGAAGRDVEVIDLPAQHVISYAWLGPRDAPAIDRARAAITAELTRRHLKPSGLRLLAYNSPFVPRSSQTHELQAIIP